MKYVKSISLFFIYPTCCFLLGVMTGTLVQSYEKSEIIINEPQMQAKETEELETVRETKQEDTMPNQYVMSPSAIQQIPEVQQAVVESGYYIALQNNYVVVFHSDRQTVFLSTDIKAEELPEDVQADLAVGMYMTDEGMLYDFLENYTS